jgi:hypothetical protein
LYGATENSQANYFALPRLNPADCKPVCKVEMNMMVYDANDRALSVYEPNVHGLMNSTITGPVSSLHISYWNLLPIMPGNNLTSEHFAQGHKGPW